MKSNKNITSYHFLNNFYNENCIPLQFSYNSDGDSITIYNVNTTDKSSNLIVRLSGPELGPKSHSPQSNWKQKIISTSSNTMVVQFKSDEQNNEHPGFSATIRFNLLNNTKCDSWMDMNNRIIQSPNYPSTSYGNDIFCNHLITVLPDFYITLEFLEFDVSFLIITIQSSLA